MSTENQVTQEEIDAAIVQCLRIFAARGRQLRLQRERERLAREQAGEPNENAKPIHAEPETAPTVPDDLKIEPKATSDAKDQAASSDVSSDESECPS